MTPANALAALAAELDELEPLPRFDLDGAEQRVGAALHTASVLGASVLGAAELERRARLVQADVWERRGDVAGSGRTAREVLRWAQEHDHRFLQARSHYVLEAVMQDLGDDALALEHAVRAVDLLEESAPPVLRLDHLIRLADGIAQAESLDAARERYVEVLRLAEELGDVDRQLVVLNNLAYFASLAGAYEEALDVSERMQALAEEHSMALHLGRVDTVARALVGLGRFAEAERMMLPALDPAARRRTPDGHAGADCLLTLAGIQRRLGEPERAQATLDECVRLCREHGLAGVATGAREEQAELHAAAGRYPEAYATYRQFHEEVMALQSVQRDARARALQAMYETSEARRQSRRYRELSLRDPLTGLYNRRYVDQELPELLRRCAERAEQLTVALVDLDHFKLINDRHSHDTGDAVLRVVAGLLEAAVDHAGGTPRSFAARVGGEEFLVVLSGRDLAAAADELEELRLAVRRHPWSALTGAEAVTVSIGAASGPAARGARTADLLSRADRHLYAAKHAGRDRVVGDS